MRYRLPVSEAPLVFFLTSGEQLWLRVGGPVGEPTLFGVRRAGAPQTFEREGAAPQQAFVARCQAEACVGRGKRVCVVRQASVRARKVSPGAAIERRGIRDPLVRLSRGAPSPRARVRVPSEPVEHRAWSDQPLSPLGESHRFLRPPLN